MLEKVKSGIAAVTDSVKIPIQSSKAHRKAMVVDAGTEVAGSAIGKAAGVDVQAQIGTGIVQMGVSLFTLFSSTAKPAERLVHLALLIVSGFKVGYASDIYLADKDCEGEKTASTCLTLEYLILIFAAFITLSLFVSQVSKEKTTSTDPAVSPPAQDPASVSQADLENGNSSHVQPLEPVVENDEAASSDLEDESIAPGM